MAEIQRSKYDELMTDPEFRDLFIKTMDADHAAEVARLEAENKRLRDALESARMYAVYLEDALYRRRRTVISLERL